MMYAYYHAELHCWAIRDEEGRGPSLGYLHNRLPDEATATQRAAEQTRIGRARGGPLSRSEYEAAAVDLGTETMADDTCRRGRYDIVYGEYSTPEYSVAHVLWMALARRRIQALDGEDAARKIAQSSAPVTQPAPWGARGVRYDEPCERCHREETVDNGSGLCARCGRAR